MYTIKQICSRVSKFLLWQANKFKRVRSVLSKKQECQLEFNSSNPPSTGNCESTLYERTPDSFYGVIHLPDKDVFVGYIENEDGETEMGCMIKRIVDGVEVIHDDHWKDYEKEILEIESHEISKEEYNAIRNNKTNLASYIAHRIEAGESYYLRHEAEDGVVLFELKDEHIVRSVANLAETSIVEYGFSDTPQNYKMIVLWSEYDGGGRNIISKEEFEEWWSIRKPYSIDDNEDD